MRLKTIITALLLVSSFSTVKADSDPPKGDKEIIIQPKPTKRPKTPSRQHVSCIYADDVLTITFLIDEGEATLTVTNLTDDLATNYVFDTALPASIAVGPLTEAILEFQTEAGHSYYGELTAN